MSRKRIEPTTAPAPKAVLDLSARYTPTVRAVLGDRAEQVFSDPAWPSLARQLRRAERAGLDPETALRSAARQPVPGTSGSRPGSGQTLTAVMRDHVRDRTDASQSLQRHPTTGPAEPSLADKVRQATGAAGRRLERDQQRQQPRRDDATRRPTDRQGPSIT
ncbi:MAG: hypothetical protein M3P91_05710 [Actinomycetota bacterium]|nr:hypothetical protein [Actinomycetota bacterium]